MRPKDTKESLNAYADAVVKDFRERASAMAPSVDVAWGMIFDAICSEGQHVGKVSPAAIVIYQRYLALAVDFLRMYPDDKKHKELFDRVRDDLSHKTFYYERMEPEKERLFTEMELDEGTVAYRRILATLRSFA
jgi:hypothetical protein